MEYIVHTRFKQKAICGDINLPALTTVTLIDNVLYWDDKPICFITSENAHNYFAINDDGNGMERGYLISSIKNKLASVDEYYEDRINNIYEDTLCLKYKRKEYADCWLWNHDFYNASIEDLNYIYSLVDI